jgi:rubrerythrin
MPKSVEELMGVALGMEREAALRYQQLSKRMEDQGEIELAETFLDLAVLEQSHGQGLIDWARRDGRPTPRARQFAWQLPETFAEADLAGAPLSGYQALAIAVRNEELAFSFYSYVSALTDMHPTLRHHAEALAHEELNHIAQLRRLRRRAFHKDGLVGQPAVSNVSDLPAFFRFAWGLEKGSAVLCRLLSERLRGSDGLAMAAFHQEVGCSRRRRMVIC